ncbi:MAG: DUF6122 family protein [Candidatus Marinimicrobia bacterium]|nr:DUF6122 family protein [Candidatus Neomarinimicrobiota bacterium]MCF7851051.1 DUF6122 family protein [Candidatus Neomarinimicrobiota bacterium]
MIRSGLHIILHFLVPAFVAPGLKKWTKQSWLKLWLTMSATIVIDLDHLLADPLYDPNRCSIGFHPLHTYPAIFVYIVLLFPKRTRVVGIGLLIHIFLDQLDCILM